MMKSSFRIHSENGAMAILGFIAVIAGLGALFAPFIYHVIWCIGMASETGSAIALLIVGLVVAPVGWVHGVALFLGYTWIG